jgi:hypothetical protein
VSTDEDERARAWQAQRRRRQAAEQARQRALIPDQTPAKAVRAAWQPITDWQAERGTEDRS